MDLNIYIPNSNSRTNEMQNNTVFVQIRHDWLSTVSKLKKRKWKLINFWNDISYPN